MKNLNFYSIALIAFIFVVMPFDAVAQSRNEVEISVLYDGSPSFDAGEPTAPDMTGSVPQSHTPGLDGGANNFVVRTFDEFAYRVDWNVNEEEAEDVTLTLQLPEFAEWNPDSTGMFSGCATLTDSPPSVISADKRTLTCILNTQREGSNGVIRPVARLLSSTDNTTFDTSATLTTADDTNGVRDGLDTLLTVSESPNVDLTKHTPERSALLNVGGVEGYVLLYPITIADLSQKAEPNIGDGPINDLLPMVQYDHMWDLTPSVRLASTAELAAAGINGTNCGPYAGNGPFTNASVTWACGPEVVGAGGYPVVEMTVSGFTSRPFPATLADGSANNVNAPQVAAGQIALWLTKAEVDFAVGDINNAASVLTALFFNSVSNLDSSSDINDETDVVAVDGNGTSGPSTKGDPANNTASVVFGADPAGDGPSGTLPNTVLGHTINFLHGPLRLGETNRFNNEQRLSVDVRLRAVGGDRLVGAESASMGTNDPVNPQDHIGQIARGSSMVIDAFTTTRAFAPSLTPFNAPLHGCIALDNTHYALEEIGSIPVNQFKDTNIVVGGRTISGPNSGPLAYVLSGGMFRESSRVNGVDLSLIHI